MFSSQIIVISSQNNVRKYHAKGHEQVLYLFNSIGIQIVTQYAFSILLKKWVVFLSRHLDQHRIQLIPQLQSCQNGFQPTKEKKR